MEMQLRKTVEELALSAKGKTSEKVLCISPLSQHFSRS